ncbi:MAG: carboxypeptidase regulatory-like domain-containing protein, partial [Gemmatimonadetes bacterium]|nr:carboxypeptidase regulatory-like domain-containing protein [Gemmatimonadota bacterium]
MLERREEGKGKREEYNSHIDVPNRAANAASKTSLFPLFSSLFPPFVAALISSCATIQEPPGGPPDFAPPLLVSVAPDSGAIIPGFKDAAAFRFNEVVAERPGAPLEQLFVVSPRPRTLVVSWHREEITVEPREGWRPGVAYQLILLPGITDLRNNRLTTGRTIVFSTGGPIPATTVAGRVVDWEGGTAAARALIEATHLPDSLVYWGMADSTGRFSLSALPPGEYVLSATVDKSGNRLREYREPFDSLLIRLDSTLEHTFWAYTHDSVGPRIRAVSRLDSLAIRIEFNQMLRPGSLDSGAVTVATLPDSAPAVVAELLPQAAYDSAQARRPAAGAADTARAARPAPGDTAAAPPEPLAPSRGAPPAGSPVPGPAAP